MRDQDTSAGGGSESRRRDEQDIKQEKPSHMNQGNQTFYPDQQKDKMRESGEKQKKEQPDKERFRKAS